VANIERILFLIVLLMTLLLALTLVLGRTDGAGVCVELEDAAARKSFSVQKCDEELSDLGGAYG